MPHYQPYTPDQAFLLPPSLGDALHPDDPVHVVREVVAGLDLSRIHAAYAGERGRPAFHPEAMVGLYLYGACRGIYSSRKLAQACWDHVSFRYLMAGAQPDFHTISLFRQRFDIVLRDLFRQVLELCRAAGLVRLGHVSLDGTKLRANASKHKAMSYERLLKKEQALEEQIARWFDEASQQDTAEDAEHGADDDGYSSPPELREPQRRLAVIRAAKARLEEEARTKAVQEHRDPTSAVVPAKAQTNFTDPASRIMHTPDGFQQGYNAQIVVDAGSQVIVAYEVTAAAPDVQRLVPMLERTLAWNDAIPQELTADAGYASESNFTVLDATHINAVIALRRYRRDEPPDADPAAKGASGRWPHRNRMRDKLATAAGKALYKLRKQTVEPVFGQMKAGRQFRQFLRRGLSPVTAEFAVVCTAHNLLKLTKVWHSA